MRGSPSRVKVRSTWNAKDSKMRHQTASSTPHFEMRATLASRCRLCSFPRRCTQTMRTRTRHHLHRTLLSVFFNLSPRKTVRSALCQLCTASCSRVLCSQHFIQLLNQRIDRSINKRHRPQLHSIGEFPQTPSVYLFHLILKHTDLPDKVNNGAGC